MGLMGPVLALTGCALGGASSLEIERAEKQLMEAHARPEISSASLERAGAKLGAARAMRRSHHEHPTLWLTTHTRNGDPIRWLAEQAEVDAKLAALQAANAGWPE